MKKTLFSILFTLLTTLTFCQSISIIPQNSSWKYLDNGTNQGTAWKNSTFNDTAWASGNAELGFGDGGEATVVSYGPSFLTRYVTTYFRKTFSVSNPSDYSVFTLNLLRDDGAIVYLNGIEVARSNMPTGLIGYRKTSSTAISGAAESTYYAFTLNSSSFVAGDNILAVEVHQSSSLLGIDLSFNLKLDATLIPICSTPTSLSLSSITESSAVLSWQSVAGATNYNIQYKQVGTPTWISTTSVNSTKSITGLLSATDYEFQVQAQCATISNFSTSTNFTTLTPPCETPSNLITDEITATSAVLSWQSVAGATNYNIQYKQVGTPTWISTTSVNSTKSITGLLSATDYEFQVQAQCATISNFSNSTNFTTLTPPCEIPTDLIASEITISTALLSWQNVSGATGFIIRYKIIETETWTTDSSSTNFLSLTQLQPDTEYEFQVKPICISSGEFSETGTFTTFFPCETPNSLVATDITNTSATLTWQTVLGITNYTIQYKISGTSTWLTETTAGNSITINDLIGTTAYEFKVQAVCSAVSEFSSIFNFTTLNTGVNSIFLANSTWKYLDNGTNQGTSWQTLNFDDSNWQTGNAKFGYGEGNETTIINYGPNPSNKYITTYFRKSFSINNPSIFTSLSLDVIRDDGVVVYLNGLEVYRNNMPEGAVTYTTLAPLSIGGSDESNWYSIPLNLSDLLEGTNIIAIEIHQQSASSSDVSFNSRLSGIIPASCGTPNMLTTTSIGSTSATLSWLFINGADSYAIQYRQIGTTIWTSSTSLTNTKTITGLTPTTDYEFKVNAICNTIGKLSTAKSFKTIAPSCDIPTQLTSSAITSNSVLLSWLTVPDATNYTINYRIVGSTIWFSETSLTASKSLINLTAGTTYEFQIQAVCSFTSDFSGLQSFITAPPICAIPAFLNCSSTTFSSVNLTWQPVEGALGYNIQHQLSGTNTWITTTSTLNTITINDLIAKTTYDFRVQAICSFIGNYCDPISFTTYSPGTDYLIGANSSWKYLDNGSNQGTIWKEATFNDSSWSSGNAKFGYGEGDEATIVNYGSNPSNKYITTYFRKSFIVNNPSEYSTLLLDVVRDDGVIVYLNGTEVYRNNMPDGISNYTTLAPVSIGGSDESNWQNALLSPSMLLSGTNVLAVEIHQQSFGSSDLSFNARLYTPSNTVTPIVTRGAYLQKLNSNGVTIRWRTDIACNTNVKYGTSFMYGNVISDTELVTEHEITVSGLLPDTKYYYTIGTTTQTLQGDINNNFYTAPEVGSETPVRIWGIGDFGNGTTKQLDVRDSYMNYTGTTPTNLWIWLGDDAYTSGTDVEFQNRVFQQYPEQFKSMPLFPTLGNHDYADVGYLSEQAMTTNFPYFSIFSTPQNGESGGVPSNSPKYYSYNYANIHFISIDTYGCLSTVGSPMRTWLSNDLAANTQKWTVVYMHHPPYTLGTHNSDTEEELIDVRNNIVPLLENYKVDLVLAGHSHVNERSFLIKGHSGNSTSFTEAMKVTPETNNFSKTTNYDGTVYAVCGTSGQNPEVVNQPGFPMAAMYFSNNINNCSLVIDVNGDNLSCKYLASTGTIVDEFTIVKTTVIAKPKPPIKDKTAFNVLMNKSSLNLNYTLNENAEVKIELITILGEIIISFDQIPALQAKGNYNFELPILEKSLSEGLYFIRMTSNGNSNVKKVYIY